MFHFHYYFFMYRPSVFYVLDSQDNFYVFDLKEDTDRAIYVERYNNDKNMNDEYINNVHSFALSEPTSFQKSYTPRLVITFNNGETCVHTLNTRLKKAWENEIDWMQTYLLSHII